MKPLRRLGLLCLPALASCLLASCASRSLKVSNFQHGRPLFNPVEYFTGKRSSYGVMENRRGSPIREVRTETSGIREAESGILQIEQDLVIGEKKSHRSWQVRQIGQHLFEATASDIIGSARGEAYGHAFHWKLTLELSPGNPLSRVQMSQWMYLQPDGETMVNHSTISKAGIVLVQVTEQFR